VAIITLRKRGRDGYLSSVNAPDIIADLLVGAVKSLRGEAGRFTLAMGADRPTKESKAPRITIDMDTLEARRLLDDLAAALCVPVGASPEGMARAIKQAEKTVAERAFKGGYDVGRAFAFTELTAENNGESV
jgi:hypothetical protein